MIWPETSEATKFAYWSMMVAITLAPATLLAYGLGGAAWYVVPFVVGVLWAAWFFWDMVLAEFLQPAQEMDPDRVMDMAFDKWMNKHASVSDKQLKGVVSDMHSKINMLSNRLHAIEHPQSPAGDDARRAEDVDDGKARPPQMGGT